MIDINLRMGYSLFMEEMKKIIILLFTASCASHPLTINSPVNSERLLANAIIYKSYVVKPKTVLGAGEQQALIDPSIRLWNTAIGIDLVNTTGLGFPINVVYVETLPALNETASAISYLRKDHCDVYVKHSFFGSEVITNLVAHELGHCIGFDHSTFPLSLMYPQVYPNNKITSEIKRMILEKIK